MAVDVESGAFGLLDSAVEGALGMEDSKGGLSLGASGSGAFWSELMVDEMGGAGHWEKVAREEGC